MSSAGTLWTIPTQASGKAIRAVAAFGGVAIDLPQGYVHYQDNKKPEFTNKFGHGKIPAWEGKDGFLLFEGSTIARYVATLSPNSGLLGNTREEAALIDQWMHLTESELDFHTTHIRLLLNGNPFPYSKPIHAIFLERQARALKTLEKHISTRTFFVGERITVADIYIATLVQRACISNLDTAARNTVPNLIRHMDTLLNQPAFAGIFGPTPILDKAPVYIAPKKEKDSEQKPKAAPVPAAPKTEKKPKPKVEEDHEDDHGIPEEPKVKNPLDDLPKSTFNLEDWKRAYSNKETRGVGGSLEWFYEHFDKEGFSIWRVDFKYPEELTQTFMSNNQIGGFFNRLEASRKYLFGSVGVLGAANASFISGALILRGQEAEPVVSVAPDWESYSFVRLDTSKDADKAFFEAALAWDLEIDGKKWVDGKNFK